MRSFPNCSKKITNSIRPERGKNLIWQTLSASMLINKQKLSFDSMEFNSFYLCVYNCLSLSALFPSPFGRLSTKIIHIIKHLSG